MIDWRAIDTVLLDMDGTLLDLHFDNHFWQEHVPVRYAEKHGLPPARAHRLLMDTYRAKAEIEEYRRTKDPIQVVQNMLIADGVLTTAELEKLDQDARAEAENAAAFADMVGARVLLHGHEPCADGYRTPNDRQVILDCCCNAAYCALVPTSGRVDQAMVLKSLVRLEPKG